MNVKDMTINPNDTIENVIRNIIAKDGKNFENDSWEVEISFKVKNGSNFRLAVENQPSL